MRLRAEVLGQAEAPFVVFLHGGGQSRRAWRGASTAIASAGYRAIAIDMRGHGESDWAPDGAYALEDWVDDLKIIASSLAHESRRPVAMIGASRGGQSGFVTAADLPSLVDAVVLADVTPQCSENGIELIRAFFSRSADGFASPAEASQVLAEMLNRKPRGDPASLAKSMRVDRDGRWYWLWDPVMGLPKNMRAPTEQPQLEDAAKRIKAPVLLLRAGNSELVRSEDVLHFRSLLPSLTVEEIDGVGHMLSGDSNDAYTDPILRFLARHMPLDRRSLGAHLA